MLLVLSLKMVDLLINGEMNCTTHSVTYNIVDIIWTKQNMETCFVAFFIGKSTHNQQIERLWRDVFEGCLCLFYELFHYLESEDLLDPDNDVHLWCLHHVYLPIVNNNINWKNAWIHHPIRTARNLSPLQLWISGIHLRNGDTLDNGVRLLFLFFYQM